MCSCLKNIRPPGVRPVVLAVATLSALLSAAGCAPQQPPQENRAPVVIDEAMLRRDWEPSVAYIPSGDVVAGVNRFPLRTPGNYTAAGTPDYPGALADYGASLLQTVALPFTYLFVPPFEPQVYSAGDLGPTYFGMPPMHPPAEPVVVDDLRVDPNSLEVVPRPTKLVYE